MNIPRTEQEFIKDINDNCCTANILLGNIYKLILGRPSGIRVNENLYCSLDRIKERLIEYGVTTPLIPERKSEESTNNYLKRIWEKNENAILSAKGLTIKHCTALIGSSSVKLPWVRNWLAEKEDSQEWNDGWFTRLQYHERKFMMPVQSFDDYSKDIKDIRLFRISNLPADIKFEDCVPTIGEVYIAHPYRQGVYLPISKYEHLIFRERIHELSKVMMALGATEIRTLQNSDNKSQSSSESSSNTSASAGVGRFGAKGAFSSFLKNLAENQKSDSIVINFKNDPMDLPKLPEGLIWYPHDKEWQHIAESRLFGNILEYEISLSSKEISLVSEIERSNIEAQAKVLFASGSYSKDSSSYTFFKEESTKTTKILIKFKSRKDY